MAGNGPAGVEDFEEVSAGGAAEVLGSGGVELATGDAAELGCWGLSFCSRGGISHDSIDGPQDG